MNDVARIIEIYETQGLDGLIASSSIPDDLEKINAQMDTLDDATKAKIENILREILAGTDERITAIEDELNQERQKLKESDTRADAMVAYLNSAKTGETE